MGVLVTGGAGYIGSHAVLRLVERGDRVTVLDDLSTGVRALVAPGVMFVAGDIGDEGLVADLLAREKIDAVMHFAGSVIVPESVADPLKYYANNTAKTRGLVAACARAGIKAFIFSSTAAVYGAPKEMRVSETSPLAPVNPYGRSKLMSEWMLEDAGHAHGLRSISLRYFNVAGADPVGRSGQAMKGATHLIKVACEVAAGKRHELEIFGTDYPTPDGTCIRDYIHVADLIEAHVLALDALRAGAPSAVYNCGYGRGASVREVVDAVGRVAGRPIATRNAPRRAGDPPALIAEAGAIRRALGWRPKHENLEFIVKTALDWERRRA
ncbi:MAG: UDP-glucose 4-epimerase GalE [Alphaproteobacteria bacterium]